jgi:hypothetical protein
VTMELSQDCPLAGFGITGAELRGSATRESNLPVVYLI